jgi:hypothetical protein
LQHWAELDQCISGPTEVPISSVVTSIQYHDCAAGSTVTLYRVAGGGYAVPGSPVLACSECGVKTDEINAANSTDGVQNERRQQCTGRGLTEGSAMSACHNDRPYTARVGAVSNRRQIPFVCLAFDARKNDLHKLLDRVVVVTLHQRMTGVDREHVASNSCGQLRVQVDGSVGDVDRVEQ